MSSGDTTKRSEGSLTPGTPRGQKGRSLAGLGGRTLLRVEQSSKEGQAEIYSLVTTTDLALLTTLMHDAISHLMNAIDKAAKVREPIDRIAAAMEETAAAVKDAIQAQTARSAAISPKIRRPAPARTLPVMPRRHRRNRHPSPKAKA